jgi:SHAQKYF class myb-like DNA-binding protein
MMMMIMVQTQQEHSIKMEEKSSEGTDSLQGMLAALNKQQILPTTGTPPRSALQTGTPPSVNAGGSPQSQVQPVNDTRATMSVSSSETSQQQPVPDSAVAPPNPMGTSAEAALAPNPLAESATSSTSPSLFAAAVPNSVVPDLMQVYECMIQSKTPQTTPTPPPNTAAAAATHQEHRASFLPPPAAATLPTGWTVYDGTGHSIQVPPVPNDQVMAAWNNPTDATGSTVAPRSAASPIPSAASHVAPVGSRAMRKRSSSTALKAESCSSSSVDEGSGDGAEPVASSSMEGQDVAIEKGRSKSRRKNADADGRWSKRFTWPEDLHRDFVAAVFDVGLKHASPSTILEFMPKHEQINTERIKSHLQKYRLHRAKSKKEFMTVYDSAMAKMKKEGTTHPETLGSGGEIAAALTQSALHDKDPTPSASSRIKGNETGGEKRDGLTPHEGGAKAKQTTATNKNESGEHTQPASSGLTAVNVASPRHDSLLLPQLTLEEKQSPVGASMGYLMGLFFSLKQQIVEQRLIAQKLQEEQAARRTLVAAAQPGYGTDDQPIQDVFDSFMGASGHPGQHHFGTAAPAPMATSSSIGPLAVAALPAGTAPLSSSRNHTVEQSNMMKRDMESQRALQNKMRALKQQEFAKYRKTVDNTAASADETTTTTSRGRPGATRKNVRIAPNRKSQQPPPPSGACESNEGNQFATHQAHEMSQQQMMWSFPAGAPLEPQDPRFQGAEAAGTADTEGEEQRMRSLSIGVPEEFWHSDVMDDQLFEFLMNN